jgi:uncharacterized repeat protein (TIGR02543 family)
MNKKLKKVIVLSLASLMTLAVPLSACDSDGDTETKVTFNYNDGVSRPYYTYVDEGEKVEEPETPTRTGYEFAYWQTQENGGEKVTFPYTFTQNTTLYAHWEAKSYTVTFDKNYANSTSESVTVEYNQTVEEPETEPTNGVYKFYYWQDSADDSGSRVTFPYTVTGDVTFYARWGTGDLLIIQVNNNYEGATSVEPLEVVPGETILKRSLTNPKRSGYEFKGWATSADATADDVISFPYQPATSLTLYAVWEKQKITVEFSDNYVESSKANYTYTTVESGETVSAPDRTPTRTGYSFVGWYTLKVGGTAVEFPYTPSRNTTIYAHWKSDLVTSERNIFDAEFTEIPYNRTYSGASGAVTGSNIIICDSDGSTGAFTQNYPTNTSNPEHLNYYVSYLYDYDDTLTFVIQAEEAVSNAVLFVSWTGEITSGLTIGPSGSKNAFKFMVNGDEINYSPYTFKSTSSSTVQYKGIFEEYRIGNISLKKGENVIELVTSNSNGTEMGGGTLKAVAPMIDYIRIETSVTLKWSPIYDNIYKW